MLLLSPTPNQELSLKGMAASAFDKNQIKYFCRNRWHCF